MDGSSCIHYLIKVCNKEQSVFNKLSLPSSDNNRVLQSKTTMTVAINRSGILQQFNERMEVLDELLGDLVSCVATILRLSFSHGSVSIPAVLMTWARL